MPSLDVGDYLTNASHFGLILDTNALMLWLAGREPDGFRKCPRVQNTFSKEHFDYIDICVGYAKALVVTPAILTEMSNLMMQDKSAHGEVWACAIRDLCLRDDDTVSEKTNSSANVVQQTLFSLLGYADTSIALAAKQTSATVISVDGLLVSKLQEQGVVAHNLWYEFPNYL